VFSRLERVLSGSLQGYHPDYSGNHRANGILVMSGPAIRHGASIHDPRQVDVTPTILALFGLATARDMGGRVLTEALASPTDVAAVPSYQTADTTGSLRPTASSADETIEEKLRALGYVE
jgi:hypothetical protein